MKKRAKTVKINNKKVGVKGFQHLIHTGNDWADKNYFVSPIKTKRCELWDGEIKACKNDFFELTFELTNVRSSAGANAGMGGVIASGGADVSIFKINNSENDGEINVLNGYVGGEIGIGLGGVAYGYSLGVDLVNVQIGGFQVNLGVDRGSSFVVGPGGVEAKVAGLGISVSKKTGVNMSLVGGVSVDLEKSCVVQ